MVREGGRGGREGGREGGEGGREGGRGGEGGREGGEGRGGEGREKMKLLSVFDVHVIIILSFCLFCPVRPV